MSANAPAPAPYLVMRGVSKSYPGVQALSGVDFDVRSGEVHALVGENGAGKSTLVKILAGAVTADAGTIEIGGQAVKIASPRQAEQYGISIIYQEFNLVPSLSVAENVLLGREPVKGISIDWAAMRATTQSVLARLGVTSDTWRVDLSARGWASRCRWMRKCEPFRWRSSRWWRSQKPCR